MWVWTSTTPGSTSSPVASTTSRAVEAGPDRSRLDRRDRGRPRPPRRRRRDPARRDDRAAANDEVRHGQRSVISISWAPSQRQRRPTSRSRSSQPSSGRTVAKWLAASWPTFDDVVHEPYGKKISHSLIPPG